MILQHVDSSAIMTVAEEAGVYAFGQASVHGAFGPNAHLTVISMVGRLTMWKR